MGERLVDAYEDACELIMQADSMLSYLWYRGLIDRAAVDKIPDLRRDIEKLLVDLRVFQ